LTDARATRYARHTRRRPGERPEAGGDPGEAVATRYARHEPAATRRHWPA